MTSIWPDEPPLTYELGDTISFTSVPHHFRWWKFWLYWKRIRKPWAFDDWVPPVWEVTHIHDEGSVRLAMLEKRDDVQ